MKKSLSLLLAIALVFGMFATSAFAAEAELTLQQKFDALKEAGIFNGYPPNGDPGFERDMTRAEFAKVAVLLLGKAENAAANKFADVPAGHWAAGFIGAAAEAKLVEGVGLNKFAPNGKVTNEQVAKILASALGLQEASAEVGGTASPWAKGWVAAAVQAGLITEQANWKANAKRSLLVSAAFTVHAQVSVKVTGYNVIDAKTVEVTFSTGEKVTVNLDTALEAGKDTTIQATYKGVAYPVVVKFEGVAISKAEQTNVREITVTFNRALTADEKKDLTYEVKNGLITYTVVPTWAADNKSVVLTSNYLPAAEYELTIKGFTPVKVKVVDEVATKVEITTNSLQKAAGQELGLKLYNQFNKEIANPSLNVTVYNATKGITIAPSSGAGATAKYDLSNDNIAKVDDNIVVTVTHSSGLSATKSFKVVAGSSATSIKLGAAQPLKDKTRITAGEDGIVIPVELKDQYGTTIKLAETSKTALAANANAFAVSGITFMVSQLGAIDNWAVNKDGNLVVDTAAAGTVVINAVNPATGATASTTVKIEAAATVAQLQLSAPGKVVVAGEDVVIPFAAVDTFGAPVAGKDVKLGTGAGEVNITSNIATTKKYINAKGELVLNFAAAGTVYLHAYVDNKLVGSLQGLTVNAAAAPVKINGIKDVQTLLTPNVSVDFDHDNITYIDTYNRTNNVPSGSYTVVSSNPAAVTYSGGKLNAVAVGKSEITVTYTSIGAASEYKFTVEVISMDDVKSYSIKTIGTLYGNSANTSASAYAVEVKLVGKTSAGTEVAIDETGSYTLLTSSDITVLGVDNVTKEIFGKKAGTATVTAYNAKGEKLAEQAVTVSEAAPVAAKVELSATDITTTVNATPVAVSVTVKDQYGVAFSANDTNGLLVSSDSSVVAVGNAGDADNKTYTVDGQKVGSATITYITNNNVSTSTTVQVNP